MKGIPKDWSSLKKEMGAKRNFTFSRPLFWPCTELSNGRVNRIRIHAQVGNRLRGFLGVEFAVASQFRQRRSHDGLGVDFEMAAQVIADLAAAKTVRSQADQTASQPRSHLIRHDLHVIAGRDNRTFRAFHDLLDVRLLFGFGRM